MRIKRFFKTALAVAPLVVGAASPAHGCLVLPENQGTATAASADAFDCGPVGCGPSEPMDALEMAAENSPAVAADEGGMFVVPVGQ